MPLAPPWLWAWVGREFPRGLPFLTPGPKRIQLGEEDVGENTWEEEDKKGRSTSPGGPQSPTTSWRQRWLESMVSPHSRGTKYRKQWGSGPWNAFLNLYSFNSTLIQKNMIVAERAICQVFHLIILIGCVCFYFVSLVSHLRRYFSATQAL